MIIKEDSTPSPDWSRN